MYFIHVKSIPNVARLFVPKAVLPYALCNYKGGHTHPPLYGCIAPQVLPKRTGTTEKSIHKIPRPNGGNGGLASII